jgi:hypothetical protein
MGEDKIIALDECSNATLIAAVVERLRNTKPNREQNIAITKLQEALLWLGTPAERLP